MESTNPHRLPRTISPNRYSLRLRPDIGTAGFHGRLAIDATVHEATSQVVLNAIELDVLEVSVRQAGATIGATMTLDQATERLQLDLDTAVMPGDLELEFTFDGTLNDKLRGFYRSTFRDDDGTEHTIATTQFESTNARRCFPCWDEPDRKAVFAVTLDVPKTTLAVSAMAERSRTDLGDDWVRIEFQPTPIMSTYLLAFVVGDLEASPAIDVKGVPIRIVHRPGRGDEIAFAHEAAAFCLEWLTDYFGVPYFGDKIDLLAIPDFAFGAMENTGCVTFREVLLLVDPETTTQPEQQRSVAVIAHELAHMWFGNLVTMQWWEGLWLKEAFATFMETSATDAYRPDWKVWEGFSLDRSAAYEVDALHSTRAIEYEVHSPADAEGMYDVLTYEKGASVVRMLEQFVGPDRFREGIRHYMRTHAYGNTVTRDLWNAIAAATGVPVDVVMHEWIYQGGFPVVEVSIDGDDLVLDQQPFRLLDRPGAPLADWNIPVAVEAAGKTTKVLMSPQGRIPLSAQGETVVVDPESHGFFRVRYDSQLARRLAEHLMDLTAGQRYGILDDLFDLVLANRASVADFALLTGSLRGEVSPSVWTAVANGYTTLAHVCPDRTLRDRVGELWARVARPQLDALGFDRREADDDLVNEVRASLFGVLGSLSRDESVVAYARAIFDGSVTTENASLESAAVRVVASTGDRSDYDEMFTRFQHASSLQVERRYLFALSRFDDESAMRDLFERTIDGSIRNQDSGSVLAMAMANRWHGEMAWEFVTSNWDRINEIVPDNAVGRMLSGVQWLEHGDPKQVHAFLADHPVPQGRLAVAQHLERLDVHVALRDRVAAELAVA